MKNFKINFVYVIATVLLIFALADCSKNKGASAKTEGLKTIRIGFPSGGSAWSATILGAASEYGYLEEYLNELGYTAELVSFVGAAPAIHEALVAKQLDYVVYAGMAGVLSKSIGIDHTLLSITHWGSVWSFVVGAGSGINTIHDLAGKKVAYTRGASPHMYLIRVLNEAGLTFNDIEAFNSTIPEGIAGVISGSIGGSIFSNGQEGTLEKDGVVKTIHKGFNADRSVYYEPTVFIARSAFHNENKDIAVAIQKSFLKAKDKAKEDVDAYYRLLSEKSGLALEAVLPTAEYNLDEAIPLNLGELYITSLKDILVFLRNNGLTAGSVDFDQWIDESVYVRAAQEYAHEK
jgi:sulfonate transport system substrate-binding protein